MTLRERLYAEMTAAMRSHDDDRRDALRMAIAAVQRAEKDGRHELSDDELVAVLSRELRQRRESMEAFRSGGREDLASREEAAIAVVAEFMPSPLSETELRALVVEAIEATGAASPRDIGRVMGYLAPRTRGRADGRQVSQIAGQLLSGAGSGR